MPTDVLPENEKGEIKDKSSSLFQFSSNISTTFDPIVEFEKDLAWNGLRYAKLVTKASPNINQTITIETRDANSKIDKQYDVIKPRKFYKVYMAGKVPVLISGEMTLKMRVTGKATGKVKITETLNLGYNDMEYGFEYRNGNYYEIKKATPNHYFVVHGKGDAKAELEVALVPSLKITAYEIATGRVVAEPYIKAAAGIEGHVDFVAGKDPNEYIGQGFDADYRLTDAYLSGGLNVYLAANLSMFNRSLVAWPNKANLNDVTQYNKAEGKGGYRKYQILAETKIMGIPNLAQPKIDFSAKNTQDSRAILVKGTAKDIVFPLTKTAIINWVTWTKPRVINTQSSSQDAVIALDSNNLSNSWFSPKQAGTYIIRLGGYSSLGSWARQYKDVEVKVTDNNQNGIMDYWEERYNLSGQDINSDADNDGLTLLEEYQQGKDPTKSDNSLIALLPNIVVNPTMPIKGNNFTLTLQGGNADEIGRIEWQYGNQTAISTQPNIYQSISHSTNNNSLLVKAKFFDKHGQVMGNRTLTVFLQEKQSEKPTQPSITPPSITPTPPSHTPTKLPATGITLCGNANDNNIACQLLTGDWKGLRQDGEVRAGQPMSYTILNRNNAECVQDKVTGLIWEQKTDDGTLRDKDNTYTWYNPDNRNNRGDAGKYNNGKNTLTYIEQLNASNYCGYNDWRLPSQDELLSIVDYGRYEPAIDPMFVNTQTGFYWSSSPYANSNNSAWGVLFNYGNDGHTGKYNSYYVRAVRSE